MAPYKPTHSSATSNAKVSEFIKKGIFPVDLSRALHLAFDRRQSSDYGEWSVLEAREAKMTVSDAQQFVTAVETYLREQALI